MECEAFHNERRCAPYASGLTIIHPIVQARRLYHRSSVCARLTIFSLVIDQFVLIAPAVEAADLLTYYLCRMLSCLLAECIEVNLSACA